MHDRYTLGGIAVGIGRAMAEEGAANAVSCGKCAGYAQTVFWFCFEGMQSTGKERTYCQGIGFLSSLGFLDV